MGTEGNEKILKPVIHPSAFIAEGARIYGDVEIGEGASVWFNAVIRGDEGKISIGANTNIQDNAVIHSDMTVPAKIGDNVTIGHGAVVRGCKIGNGVMVGMNSTIMTSAEIGEGSVVGANAFVPYNRKFPPRSLIVGSPARLVRELSEDEMKMGRIATRVYEELREKYSGKKIIGHDQ